MFGDLEEPNSEVRRLLREHDLKASLIYSHEMFLDVLPYHASKGYAVRYLKERWGLAPNNVLVAGDSGNDAEMLRMAECGVVVANYSRELRRLRGREGIYFAGRSYARGILEGIRHFGFDRPLGEPTS